MKIETKTLKSQLDKVMIAVGERNSIIEQMGHFIFNDDVILAYNGQLYCSIPFDSGLKASVNAQEFYKIISRTEGEVEITVEENQLKVKGKKVKAGFNLIEENEILPIITTVEKQTDMDFLKLPDDFSTGVKLCCISAGKDDQGTLACLKVEGNRLITCDSMRISVFEMNEKMPDFFVKATAIREVVRNEITHYNISDSWINFLSKDDCVYSVRLVFGNYPDISTVTNSELQETSLVFPKEIKESVEMVSILDEDNKMYVTISESSILFRVQKEKGWIESDVALKEPSKMEAGFIINPFLLHKLVSSVDKVTIQLSERFLLCSAESFKQYIGLIVNLKEE